MANYERNSIKLRNVLTGLRVLLPTALLFNPCTGITADLKPDYEATVTESIESMIEGDLSKSQDIVNHLIEHYPNSKLGYKLLGDILSVRALQQPLVNSEADRSDKQLQLSGYSDEIKRRWTRAKQTSPVFSGLLPSNLVMASPAQQYILTIDAQAARLYIYENLGDNYRLVKDYYITVGKEGMRKTLEGDKKTPLGVYFIYDYLPGRQLPDRYGPGAFPINYPNEYDQLLHRSGYGIWIHGTESENYTRTPLASDGCISLSNEDFININNYINTNGNTPVIISNNINWVTTEEIISNRKKYLDLLFKWVEDYKSLNSNKYLANYSQDQFRTTKFNYAQWSNYKRQVISNKKFINLNLTNISIYEYPDAENMLIISFDQEYRSNNYSDISEKTQYWRKNTAGQWKIIYES